MPLSPDFLRSPPHPHQPDPHHSRLLETPRHEIEWYSSLDSPFREMPPLPRSYPHPPTPPGSDRMFDRCTIGSDIIAIPTRSIDRHDLVNGHAVMPHNWYRHLAAHIPVQDEPIPMIKTILPALHQRIATPIPVNTGTILDTAFIAQRARHGRLPSRAKPRLMPEEGQRVHRDR